MRVLSAESSPNTCTPDADPNAADRSTVAALRFGSTATRLPSAAAAWPENRTAPPNVSI